MKAISLHNPYASLIAHDLKHWETRPMRTHHRGPLAICAARVNAMAHHIPTGDQSNPWRYAEMQIGCPLSTLPGGVVVAVVDVVDCIPSREWVRRHVSRMMSHGFIRELAYGDFAAGRFAWKLDNLRKIERPIPVKGQQGMFNLSPEVEALVLEQIGEAVAA
jgi:hypothetical protein